MSLNDQNIATRLRSHFSNEMWDVLGAVSQLAGEKKQATALVGGVIRDLLLDRPVGDTDIMAEHPAKPLVADLAKRLNAEMVSHERFFTFTLTLPSKTKIDIVTAREETYSAPAKLPDVTPSTIEKDLKRRDFTINSVACLLSGGQLGELLDPFDGRADMQKKIVRVLHEKSFEDDPTRIFRAARFAGRLGFEVESQTEKWILEAMKKGIPQQLTPVRRRHEFELLLKEPNPIPSFKILKRWKALSVLHPDWGNWESSEASFKSVPVLAERLIEWFQPFGSERAKQMMTDLAFEKMLKTQILSKLVQSPSTS